MRFEDIQAGQILTGIEQGACCEVIAIQLIGENSATLYYKRDGEPRERLLVRCGAQAGAVRALAYRLYTLCERKGWAEDARAYNELVIAWPDIEQASLQFVTAQPEQASLL